MTSPYLTQEDTLLRMCRALRELSVWEILDGADVRDVSYRRAGVSPAEIAALDEEAALLELLRRAVLSPSARVTVA